MDSDFLLNTRNDCTRYLEFEKGNYEKTPGISPGLND
jgi:hypothetical protein